MRFFLVPWPVFLAWGPCSALFARGDVFGLRAVSFAVVSISLEYAPRFAVFRSGYLVFRGRVFCDPPRVQWIFIAHSCLFPVPFVDPAFGSSVSWMFFALILRCLGFCGPTLRSSVGLLLYSLHLCAISGPLSRSVTGVGGLTCHLVRFSLSATTGTFSAVLSRSACVCGRASVMFSFFLRGFSLVHGLWRMGSFGCVVRGSSFSSAFASSLPDPLCVGLSHFFLILLPSRPAGFRHIVRTMSRPCVSL